MKHPTPQSALRGTATLLTGRIASRILGLVREILSASLFGAGSMMDCFNLSYTVLIAMRRVFAEQFLTPVVPTYFQRKQEDGEQAALKSISAVTTRLFIFALLASIAIFALAGHIVRILAPGFDAEKMRLAAVLIRWFAVGGLGIILHRYFAGIHICFFRYNAIAFCPLFMNLVIIGAMVFFAVKYGIVSLAAGISIGFLVYLAALYIFLPHRSEVTKPCWGRGDPGVKRYSFMIMPLFIAVSFEQVQLFVDRALASGLPEGSLSAQGYALRLVGMLSVFIVGTFGSVIFPVFTSLVSRGDKDKFAHNFSLALQGVILLLSLAAAILIPLTLPIVRLVLERGAFTLQNSILTADLVGYYVVAYSAQTVLFFIVRGFHAHGNTRTPTIITLISAAVMIAADFILVGPMGIFGLALATAIGYTLNMTLNYLLFSRNIPRRMIFDNLKMLCLGLGLAGALGWLLSITWSFVEGWSIMDSFWGLLFSLVLLISLATSIYLFILYLLRVPAFEYFRKKFKEKRAVSEAPLLGDD